MSETDWEAEYRHWFKRYQQVHEANHALITALAYVLQVSTEDSVRRAAADALAGIMAGDK